MRSIGLSDLPHMPIGCDWSSYTLPLPLRLESWVLPAGVKIKMMQTSDFGLVLIKPGTKTVHGMKIPRRFFSY
jgi:hypothetical protein